MRRRAAVFGTAAVVALCCSAGCAPGRTSSPAPPVSEPPSAAPAYDPGPPPAPEALTDVLNRLADPALPGTDKLALVADATPADAATLDRFAAALRDGGFAPARFAATDITWAGRPSTALATITVSTPDPAGPGDFSFPMEFRTADGGWQLTRDTAEMLLAFGDARAVDAHDPPAAPR